MMKNFKGFINEQYTNMNIKIGDIYSESDVYSYIQNMHKMKKIFMMVI